MPLRPLSHSCNLFAVSVGMIDPFKLAPPKTCPVCQIVEIQATETQDRLVYRCPRCGTTVNIGKPNSRRWVRCYPSFHRHRAYNSLGDGVGPPKLG